MSRKIGRADLSDEKVAEAREAFKLFDKNGDGRISACELGAVMTNLGQATSEKEIQEIMDALDTDKNGSLEFEEFLEFIKAMPPREESDVDLRQAFAVFDKDGSGTITESELKQAMKSLGEKMSDAEVRAMIKDVDLNGDGKIDYNEFVRMLELKD